MGRTSRLQPGRMPYPLQYEPRPARPPEPFNTPNPAGSFLLGSLLSGVAYAFLYALHPPAPEFSEAVPCMLCGGYFTGAVVLSFIAWLSIAGRCLMRPDRFEARPWWLALLLGSACEATVISAPFLLHIPGGTAGGLALSIVLPALAGLFLVRRRT